MKLRPHERCPIHDRRDCCGRSEFRRYPQVKKPCHGVWIAVRAGLWRTTDGREKCSKAELRRRKNTMLLSGVPCAACGQKFTDYDQVELAHRIQNGIGGGKRNDAKSNLTLLHFSANREQGSMDLEVYLATKWKPESCNS